MLEVLSLAPRTNPSVDSWFSSPSDLGIFQVGLLCVSGTNTRILVLGALAK